MEKNEQAEGREQQAAGHSSVLKRRRELGAQLKCPKCGVGRMPESRYCAHCGSPLPEIHHEASPEELERKRPSRRALNWLIDLMPGVVSLKIVLASLAVCLAGGAGLVVALRLFEGVRSAGTAGAIFVVFFYVAVGLASFMLYVLGIGWLVAGEICVLWEAFAEFRLKHWLFALAVTVIMARAAFWFA